MVDFMNFFIEFKSGCFVKKEDLKQIKKDDIPPQGNYSIGPSLQYYDKNGIFKGTACTEYFLRYEPVVNFLMDDIEFVAHILKQNVDWFLDDELKDIFIIH